MINNNSVSIGSRSTFTKKVVFVEGISRSGKFLLSRLLACLEEVDPVQYDGLLEQIPIFVKAGLMDEALGREIIRAKVDEQHYGMLIGRNFNLRESDKSCMLKMLNSKELLQRAKTNDITALLQLNRSHYAQFILHESFENIQFFFTAFPQAKVISLWRNPVDVVYSWYQRKLIQRWGNDPMVFQVPQFHNGENIPWFLRKYEKNVKEFSDLEKTVLAVNTIYERAFIALETLSHAQQRKVLCINYEAMLSQPERVVTKLGKFLGKQRRQMMSNILKQEKLPTNRKDDFSVRERFIKSKISMSTLEVLKSVEEKYNSSFKNT